MRTVVTFDFTIKPNLNFLLFFVLILTCFLAQFLALEDENQRRREECVQLRTILAERSQSNMGSIKTFDSNDDDLNEALQAQKLVNR